MGFLHPLGLGALILPLVLLWTSLRRREPLTIWLGTSRFFGESSEGEQRRRSRKLSPARIAAIVSLTLAAVGLAKPGYLPELPKGFVVEVHLDQARSMGLPMDPATPSGDTRREAALRRFRAWAEEFEATSGSRLFAVSPAVSFERMAWRDLVDEIRDAGASTPGAEEPGAHSTHGRGTVWITDRAPLDVELWSGGVFASGGPAVPGAISVGPRGALEWDPRLGETYAEDAGRAATVFRGRDLPDLVARILGVWAEDRGARFVESEADADLSVRRAETQETPADGRDLEAPETLATGRDGWSLPATVPRPPGALGPLRLAPWLTGTGGRVLVAEGPGRVIVDIEDFGQGVPQDPAFAVSWAQLFDRARRLPRDVVSRSERLDAGAGLSRPPSDLPTLEEWETASGRGASDARLERDEAARRARTTRGWLSAAAALFGLLALALKVRSG